ncbi:hypothetical protein FA15DRAFT_609138 [Coprinopsis marcescibilis]|uniref:Uncharacterized protein n=1 Tax=Coprinopsis marcescibilis TaxID=230819 RepID=A0A5C3LB40_COPMA|nr:hypothetical protein FA15DRAFT_609138 [Coprinopsis marcescibilis]
MPVPTTNTPLRNHRPLSPQYSAATPIRTISSSTSNYSAYTPTVTHIGGVQKLNVVTRVALEGGAKHGDDGASIKMFLKLSIPLDSAMPGTTIPLFPEENVKILSSQLHPLDNNSAPYNFSSTVSPLLHRAAKALNLPARSAETFQSVFGISHANGSTPSSSRMSKSESNSEMIPPVDEHYTGQILVSGYNVSYILPKSFPSQSRSFEDESYSRPTRSRRPSISERQAVQFMAAIDLWVPYVSRPPRSPYLLSIPTPRCLHNHIKLRIFPPNQTSGSAASLSSLEDEGGTWDLAADPHVTRGTSKRLARSRSFNSFADDESSDSSTAGFADGCGLQGTFPSAERIRIRWAAPSKSVHIHGINGRDGRRRVGAKQVKGEMTCVIRGRGLSVDSTHPKGILMDVHYTATCSGVWFPGVATLLGMDVGLEGKGSDISWAADSPAQWSVKGGVGFTGYDVGPSSTIPTNPNSRASSFESNSSNGQVPEGLAPSNHNRLNVPNPESRSSSTSSTSSLLRAPLPNANVMEYSFEGSGSSIGSNASYSSPPGTMSSIPSLPASTPSMGRGTTTSPSIPITIHLNMNDLVHPAKNVFTFTISGTIVVAPKSPLSRLNNDKEFKALDPTMLPKFSVLAADSESTSTLVRHEVDALNCVIEVYNPTGDIYRDAQAKKTVLRQGGFTKCGEDGGRIVLKYRDEFSSAASTSSSVANRTHNSVRAPSTASSRGLRETSAIPRVDVTVCPFTETGGWTRQQCYGVALKFPVPVSKDLSCLEFGFASNSTSKVKIISATVDGVLVDVSSEEVKKVEAQGNVTDFDSMNGREWANWVKLDVASLQGGDLVFEYVVKATSDKGKGKALGEFLDVLLPTFPLSINKLDVKIEVGSDTIVSVLETNLEHKVLGLRGNRLVHYSLTEFFSPRLVLSAKRQPEQRSPRIRYFVLSWILIILAAVWNTRSTRLGSINSHALPSLANYSDSVFTAEETVTTVVSTTTVTATTTMTATTQAPATYCRKTEDSQTQISPSYFPAPSSEPASEEHRTLSAPTQAKADTHPHSEDPQPSTTLSVTPMSSLSHAWHTIYSGFEIPWINRDFAESIDVKTKYEAVKQGVAVLWRYMRTIYHYPLEAP